MLATPRFLMCLGEMVQELISSGWTKKPQQWQLWVILHLLGYWLWKFWFISYCFWTLRRCGFRWVIFFGLLRCQGCLVCWRVGDGWRVRHRGSWGTCWGCPWVRCDLIECADRCLVGRVDLWNVNVYFYWWDSWRILLPFANIIIWVLIHI